MKNTMAMKTKLMGIATALTVAVVLLVGNTIDAQSGTTFKARLTMCPTDMTTRANTTGSGSATAVLAGNKLTVSGTFEGLSSPATIAQIHGGQIKGVRGPVISDLTISKEASGTVSGSLDLTPAQLEDLKNGRIYIQIHSERAPNGSIWGWFMR